MALTVLALIMTVLIGGFIAYFGDLTGRKFGKRRVSLLGLRPKHTAILITSVTGIFISALTTGFLFMIVPSVRDAILNGEEAIRQRPIFERQARESKLQAIAAKSRLITMDADLANSSKETARARREQVHAQKSRDETVLKMAAAERAYQSRLRTENQKLAQAKDANRQEQRKSAVLARSNVDLAKANVEVARSNTELTATRDRLVGEVNEQKKQRAALAKSNAELAKSNAELAKENGNLSQENDQIAKVNEGLHRENERLAKQNEVMTRENVRLASENDDQRRINKDLIAFGRNQSGLFEKMRTGRIAVHRDEDLARNVIPKNVAPDVVLRRLDQLMHDASVAAREKGAAASEGGGARAVEVVDKQFYAASSNGGPIPVHVTANERIQAVVNSLAWSDSPVCVLALAVANSVEGEPAAIDFQPFPERLIYSKGYIVGSRRFDANWPADKLYAALTAFLKDLGKGAIDRGMIPRMDPVTGEPRVGSMDLSELVDVVERMRARNRPVKVTALAKEDLSASEPLKLDFRIDNSL